EPNLSLKLLKALVFGEKPKPPKPPPSDGPPSGGSGNGSNPSSSTSEGVSATPLSSPPRKKPPPPGHGRHGADVYRGAQTVECRHWEVTVGGGCAALWRQRV